MDHPFRCTGPGLLLAVPLLCGFFLGLSAGPCRAVVASCFLLLSLLSIVFRRSPVSSAFAVTALCGVLAAGRLHLLDADRVGPFRGAEVALRGDVSQVRHTDSGWNGIVEGARVSALDGSESIWAGRVLLSVRNPVAAVSFPAEVRATGRLYPLKSLGNPGEVPREWTALAHGVQYRFFADASRTVFLPVREEPGWGMAGFRRARSRVARWLAAHAGDSDGALYLRAVATGMVPASSHPMVTLLRRTGLGHLLAISGMHVVLFFSVQSYSIRLAIWVIRRRHGAPDLNRLTSFFSLPGCWAYALMAGSPVSAIRAAGMLSVVVFLRHLLGVRGSGAAWTVLFLSTIVCAPSLFVSPSLLLSYGASFFLIAAFGGKGRSASPPLPPLRAAAGWARDVMIGSTMAFLGTLPLSAAFFGRLPAGAILWNFLFVPVLGTVGVAGAFLGVAGGVFSVEPLGAPVRIAAEFLSDTLAALAFASGNGSCWFPLHPAGIAAPIVCTGGAAAGSLWLRTRGKEPWPAAAAASIVFLVWIHIPYAALPDHRLTLAALNVGKGAAHVLSFPGGGHMLVDCGSGLRGDRGETVVLPYLRARGIRRIDVLVLTHPHEDHYGGAAAVLSSLSVGEIWIPEGASPDAFGRAVRERTDRIRWKTRGDRYRSGGAEVIVRGTGKPTGWQKPNEQSLLLEIRHGNFSAWLPGDVERGPSAWGAYPRRGKGAKTVLFLPHHGSAMAKPGAWIRAASPDAVVSQNSDCLIRGNLVPSGLSFFLENGAVIMQSDGTMVFIDQDRRPSLWELLLRLPSEGSAKGGRMNPSGR